MCIQKNWYECAYMVGAFIYGPLSVLAYIFLFGITCWTQHELHWQKYTSNVGQAIQRAYGPIYARIDSWSQVPFVDVTVIDAAENPQGCPASHPDELIFEVWPGTMGLCDGLEAEGHRKYELGKPCDKAGDVGEKYEK